MVFTVEEETSHPNQTIGMLPKGKQGRQRKNSGALKKGKNVSTKIQLNSKKSKAVEPLMPSERGSCSNPAATLARDEMGGIASSISTNCKVSCHKSPADLNSNTDSVSNNVQPIINSDLVQVHEAMKLTKELPISTRTQADVSPASEKKNCDSVSGSEPSAEVNTPPTERLESDTQKQEIQRLKQLLLLQVSLISRQQDLLRLRDREIMQLKASNQNYKCQLNRVRRRMSNKKDNPWEEVLRPSPSSKSVLPSDTETVSSEIVDTAGTSGVNHNDTTTLKTPLKRRRVSSKGSDEFQAASDSTNISMKTPTTGEKDSIPVPVSFIERRQQELLTAMITSPPDKALKNFCMIADSPSPQGSTSKNLAEFPFKICDRCPHCVAIAAEIARLIKIAENSETSELSRLKLLKREDLEILNLAGVSPASLDVENKGNDVMRTSLSYFRHSPTFDLDHWWWDLKCGNIKSENKLNIPTWKEQPLPRLPLDPESYKQPVENVDDATYMKRHVKHEQDEKRRKRWDIQRIREYRHNEKLRQKQLKQTAVYDAPMIETFAGHLHDAEAVEVNETLPVNVFGYPAPHCEPEEFSLTPMYQMPVSGASRRKSRNVI